MKKNKNIKYGVVSVIIIIALLLLKSIPTEMELSSNFDFTNSSIIESVHTETQKDTCNIELTECIVTKIVDGDTIKAISNNSDSEIKIRLIGIDTPESVHSDNSKNTIWGQYASAYTKKLLSEGQTIWLEYDTEQTDRYGRTLAYVWLSEDTSNISNMLNAKLLEDGYAMNKEYKPNIKYSSQFEQIRITAMESKTGLWSDEGFCNLWE